MFSKWASVGFKFALNKEQVRKIVLLTWAGGKGMGREFREGRIALKEILW